MLSGFSFPASELDQPSRLLEVVGSFWSNVYGGNYLVQSMLHARAQLDTQAHLDLLELIASMSRFNVPVFHTDNWLMLTLVESQRNETDANLAAYDGTLTYSDAFQARYGVPLPTAYHCWKLPHGFRGAKLLLNRITASSLTWAEGVDYFVVGDVVFFRENPFDNDFVPKREVFEGSQVVDREAALWAYRGQWDWDTVYRQFGYVLGAKLKSSQAYKDFLNALFDALVEGTSQRATEAALAAICDVPLVMEAEETVEHVLRDRNALWVITDKHAYRFHPESAVTVAAGDVLKAGDTMTDTLSFFEFNRGQVPDADDIRAIAVGKGFLASGYFQDIVFENKSVPLTVESSDDGYTRVSFEVKGTPGDVEKFWDDVHERGVAAGQTLAMLLDRRANKVGQPTAVALPKTINPFGFLCQNVFRNNLALVRVKTHLFGPDALGMHNARLLRKIIPPHTALIVLSQLAIRGDEIIMEGPGDEQHAGYEEDVTVFLGASISEEIDPDEMIEESVRVTVIQGRCE